LLRLQECFKLFMKLMNEQGMSTADLLQSNNLQQLVLASNGETDILAALTDENIEASIQQLLKTVSEIKDTSNLSLTDEQVKAIMLQVDKQTKATINVTEQSNTALETMSAQESSSNQREDIAINVDNKDNKQSADKTDQLDTTGNNGVKVATTEEGNTDNHSDARREQNQDLAAEDQFQNFIDNLVKTSQDSKVEFTGNLTQVTEVREIANQIIERIKVSIRPDQTSMELQLNPENLGKVNLSVQSKDGIMTAQFVVQNEVTKEAIESQLHILRDTLNQQGIKVEAIEVTVSAYAFEQNSSESPNTQSEEQKGNSGRKITLEEALGMPEMQVEDTDTQDLTGVRGSQIDYTA